MVFGDVSCVAWWWWNRMRRPDAEVKVGSDLGLLHADADGSWRGWKQVDWGRQRDDGSKTSIPRCLHGSRFLYFMSVCHAKHCQIKSEIINHAVASKITLLSHVPVSSSSTSIRIASSQVAYTCCLDQCHDIVAVMVLLDLNLRAKRPDLPVSLSAPDDVSRERKTRRDIKD